MAEHRLWYDKYRPNNFDEYVWTDPQMKAQVGGWIEKGSMPSVCFAGGPGRGKTSLAWVLIQQLGVSDEDVLFLRGSIENNTETVRSKILEFCELGGWSGLRIVFMDEADNLSHAAQAMLRNVIDDYSSSVRFIFTCNFPHRIIEALWSSRMIRIDIEMLPEQDFLERMLNVLVAENVDMSTDEAVNNVIAVKNVCYPDLRKALNLLEDSVRDGVLRAPRGSKAMSAGWEPYFREVLTKPCDVLQEVTKIRQVLAALMPDEMEDVYRFLYHNGTSFFGGKQLQAIVAINAGQKAHRNALLPEMILLEVFLRLITLMNQDDAG